MDLSADSLHGVNTSLCPFHGSALHPKGLAAQGWPWSCACLLADRRQAEPWDSFVSVATAQAALGDSQELLTLWTSDCLRSGLLPFPSGCIYVVICSCWGRRQLLGSLDCGCVDMHWCREKATGQGSWFQAGGSN